MQLTCTLLPYTFYSHSVLCSCTWIVHVTLCAVGLQWHKMNKKCPEHPSMWGGGVLLMCGRGTQSNSSQCNVHGSHGAIQRTAWNVTFHWNRVLGKLLWRVLGKLLWIGIFQVDQPEICVHLYTKMLHVNRTREPHVTPDSFISDTVSNTKSSKFHQKIPAC